MWPLKAWRKVGGFPHLKIGGIGWEWPPLELVLAIAVVVIEAVMVGKKAAAQLDPICPPDKLLSALPRSP